MAYTRDIFQVMQLARHLRSAGCISNKNLSISLMDVHKNIKVNPKKHSRPLHLINIGKDILAEIFAVETKNKLKLI
jgi:hypothetical protein